MRRSSLIKKSKKYSIDGYQTRGLEKLKSINGIAYNITQSIVGKIISAANKKNGIDHFTDPIIRTIIISEDGLKSDCRVTNEIFKSSMKDEKHLFIPNGISEFECGDIVLIEPTGHITFLYKYKSKHNSILFTEKCNHNCIMCSQPPQQDERFPDRLRTNYKIVKHIPRNCVSLGITGGEPTLHWNHFVNFVKELQISLPDTLLHILTNGRAFFNEDRAKEMSYQKTTNFVLAIPLYSDDYLIHDNVVQSKGAFHQTIRGLYNLAKYNLRIEIRIVIMKTNFSRINKLARFIYKNLPFVEHVAFMGLEPIGNAIKNMDEIYINPSEYISELESAVRYLNSLSMNTSIYNLPLCLIPESIKLNYRKAISDWKNIFVDECKLCKIQNDCGGFFLSANEYKHEYLQPVYN